MCIVIVVDQCLNRQTANFCQKLSGDLFDFGFFQFFCIFLEREKNIIMENPWLVVEEENSCSIDECGRETYYGVFNRKPSDIAKMIKRPAAPKVVRQEFCLPKKSINIQIKPSANLARKALISRSQPIFLLSM